MTYSNISPAAQSYFEIRKGEATAAPAQPALTYSALFHIMGLSSGMIKRCCEGGTLCLRQRFDAATALREAEEKRIVSVIGVPTTWIATRRAKTPPTA